MFNLNFLIAVVNDSYIYVNENQAILMAEDRNDMNETHLRHQMVHESQDNELIVMATF